MMKLRTREWITFASCLIGIVGVLFVLSLFVPLYGEICTKQNYSEAEECVTRHIGPFVLFWIIQSIDEHNGLITAFATVVMAAFTGTLWFVTKKAVDLARAEFIATHRPRVRLQKVVHWDFGEKDSPASVEIVIANAGESSATIICWRAVLYIQTHDTAFWPDLNESTERTPAEFSLSAGASRAVIAKQETAYWTSGDLMAGEAEMFLVGDISYIGGDGITRSTGFARRFAKGHWKPVRDSEYEYAY